MVEPTLRPQDFLAGVRDRALAAAGGDPSEVRSRIFYGTLQLHYGNPRIHYEVWLVRKTGRIEVGLHCEDEPERNCRVAEALAPRVHEIRDVAGPDVDLEQWTASWTRLHLTLPLGPLTPALRDQTAARLATLIAATRWLLTSPALTAPNRAAHRHPAPSRRGVPVGR